MGFSMRIVHRDGTDVVLPKKHDIAGGTYAIGGTASAWLYVTCNYAPIFFRVIGGGGDQKSARHGTSGGDVDPRPGDCRARRRRARCRLLEGDRRKRPQGARRTSASFGACARHVSERRDALGLRVGDGSPAMRTGGGEAVRPHGSERPADSLSFLFRAAFLRLL